MAINKNTATTITVSEEITNELHKAGEHFLPPYLQFEIIADEQSHVALAAVPRRPDSDSGLKLIVAESPSVVEGPVEESAYLAGALGAVTGLSRMLTHIDELAADNK